MAAQNSLIRKLLRIITPDEIADIATKHNGGKFLSLTNLVTERVEHKIFRNFSTADSIDEIHEEHLKQLAEKEGQQAKILPFIKSEEKVEAGEIEKLAENSLPKPQLITRTQKVVLEEESVVELPKHEENENMSTFILIEKARLKKSQKNLKQKEIIDLYQKNSSVDVEQVKASNNSTSTEGDAGVLVNQKRY